MKKMFLRKTGAIALLGVNMAAIAFVPKSEKAPVYTKLSAEVLKGTDVANAQLAEKAGGGSFWQGVGGGVGAIGGAALGTYLGGPWGGYIGTVLGGGAGAW